MILMQFVPSPQFTKEGGSVLLAEQGKGDQCLLSDGCDK